MLLEDEFADIIKKASAGLQLSLQELSRVTEIPLKELQQLTLYKQPSPQQVELLAEYLRLDADKLTAIAFRKWHPKQQTHKEVIPLEHPYGSMKVNSYLLIKNSECLIIDAGSGESILQEIRKRNLKPLAIMITHPHADHVAGVSALTARLRCPVYEEKEDSIIEVGPFTIQILKTPGHHQNHNCFLFKNYCFVGDLIFAGSIGNSNDVPYHTHLATIKKKILSLPESTILFPGHGPATSVKEELQHNPFF